MKFLLDVSALLSLGVLDHEFHERAAIWLNGLARKGVPQLATCAITELGFVRVLAQVSTPSEFRDEMLTIARDSFGTDLFTVAPATIALRYYTGLHRNSCVVPGSLIWL
jgi:predicted nucleic acid-binding protein